MKRLVIGTCLLLASVPATGQDAAAVLDAAGKAMGTSTLTSIQYSGSGSSYFFGQAPTPGGPWPRFVLKSHVTDINYDTASMRQDISRTNEDGSGAAHLIQFVCGNDAWDLTGTPPAATPMFRETGSSTPAAQDRSLRIWMTPPGFIKAAQINHATVKTQGPNKLVQFALPDHRIVTATITAKGLITRISSLSDNPILGDTPIELLFDDYQPFGGIQFPTRIVQVQGGQQVLDLKVTDVKPNAPVAIEVPPVVRGAKAPAVTVASQKLADGLWFLKGASHNSLVADFTGYIVVIEGPVNEAQADAVIAEARRLVPGKPIRYLVNTHHHFDHLGGVRDFANEGTTIISTAVDRPYYEQIFRAPHTLNPDKLATSRRNVMIEGVADKRVLSDGAHTIELYTLSYKPHVDSLMFVYFPKEKTLVQADVTVAAAANAPAPATPNPLSVKLYDDIQRLKLDVAQIVGIHGGVTTIAQLQSLVGKP